MKYRLYSFVNHLYMNEKQWGIQTAHCVSTMSRAYKVNTEQKAAYDTWADEEPTIIMCQGGNVAMLTDLYERISVLAKALNLPYVKFHEDEASLGGVITAVAVLVPETLFDHVVNFENGEPVFCKINDVDVCEPAMLTVTEYDFLKIIKLAKLA